MTSNSESPQVFRRLFCLRHGASDDSSGLSHAADQSSTGVSFFNNRPSSGPSRRQSPAGNGLSDKALTPRLSGLPANIIKSSKTFNLYCYVKTLERRLIFKRLAIFILITPVLATGEEVIKITRSGLISYSLPILQPFLFVKIHRENITKSCYKSYLALGRNIAI
jgi:hypothetical protein